MFPTQIHNEFMKCLQISSLLFYLEFHFPLRLFVSFQLETMQVSRMFSKADLPSMMICSHALIVAIEELLLEQQLNPLFDYHFHWMLFIIYFFYLRDNLSVVYFKFPCLVSPRLFHLVFFSSLIILCHCLVIYLFSLGGHSNLTLYSQITSIENRGSFIIVFSYQAVKHILRTNISK